MTSRFAHHDIYMGRMMTTSTFTRDGQTPMFTGDFESLSARFY